MNFTAIHSLFDSAITEGLKYPKIRLQTSYGKAVVISRNGAKSKSPGQLSVTDGEQFGFGAEIGISTQKLHARGPMGLPELTSTKWIAWGDGQTRPA